MTITSTGYTGTIAPNTSWANMQYVLGHQYWVGTSNTPVVTGTSDGSRKVNIDTGSMGGWGIYDLITATESVTLPVVATDTYFMICAHRDWSAKATTFVAINAGTTLPTTPPARTTGPGVVDEQPIELVKSDAAGTTTMIYGLQAIGGKGFYRMDGLANAPTPTNWMSHLGAYGIEVHVLNAAYFGGASSGWTSDPTIIRSGPSLGNALGIAGASGWSTVADLESRVSISGNIVQLLLQARHSSTTNPITFSSATGNNGAFSTPFTVGTVAYRPPYDLVVPMAYLSSANASYSGVAIYRTDGVFVVVSGAPGTDIGVNTAGNWSIKSTFSWVRET